MIEKKIPEKWASSSINELFSFVLGGDWGKDPLKFESEDYELALCIRGSEIRNWKIEKSATAVERLVKKSSLEKRSLLPGDVVIEISGGGPEQPVGRTIYIDEESLNNDKNLPSVCTNFLRMMRFHSQLNSKYIQLYLQLFYDSGSIINYQGGSNNLRNLKFKDFETIKIPIATRAEQDRIVSKADTLMAQVATMQKSMQHIPQLLKDFRQQVLTQAVTGKLTEEWHKENDVENWKQNYLKNFVLDTANGLSKRSGKEGLSTTVLRLADFTKAKRVYGNEREIIMSEKEIKKYSLLENDIIVIRVNGSVDLAGRFIKYIKKNKVESYCDHFIRYRFNLTQIIPDFLTYIANCGEGRKYLVESLSTSAGQNTINQKSIGNLIISLPEIKEQQEIVRRVESLFAKAAAIETQYQNLKTKIDILPQAILHQAFKGELVEQLPTDGDARELLKEIEGLKE